MKLLPLVSLLSFSMLVLGCDEELPPQNDPKELFTSTITSQYQYAAAARPTQSSIDIYIVYKNSYEETLNDIASLKGTIMIEWLVPPEERGAITPYRTDQLTIDNLFQASGYNFSTNRLSIDPKDSIILRYRWNLKTNDSTNLISQVKYAVDRDCLVNISAAGDVGNRAVSVKQQFRVTTSFSIFQHSGAMSSTAMQFSSCWIAPHFGERSPCNQPNPFNPCSVISTVPTP